MPSSIPHQKFCFYHLPTRGRAGIKLGDAWYVSNVSIIFYCSIYIIFCFGHYWALSYTFILLFGTNLLTDGLAQDCCFLSISEFRRKRISNGVQTEWNLRECDFRNERDPEDLDPMSRHQLGGQEVGGAPSTLVGPMLLHRRTSSSNIYLRTPKRSDTEPKT